MDEQVGADQGGQKRRSFTEAVAMFSPIVPLPGDVPRASVAVVPDALDGDLPLATGPQPVPLPPRLHAAVLPSEALRAPGRTAPEQPDGDLSPVQDPQPTPPSPQLLAQPSLPSQAAPKPEAEPMVEVPARPKPIDDAAFRQSIAPPSLSAMPGKAAVAVADRTRPMQRQLWPWAVLLVLSAAGTAAFWVQYAPKPPTLVQSSVEPTAELAIPAPASVASPPEAMHAPSLPADVATEPALPVAPQALSEPAPEPTSKAAPELALEAAPAADAPRTPDLVGPEPEALMIEPSPAELLAPNPEPAAASLVPTLPIPPVPIPPAPALAPPNRRVVIYHRPASSVAAAEAARLVAKLRPLAAQVETRTTAAMFRLPTLRYFHPEDADAAQKLAAALRRSDAEWRVRGMLSQDPLPPLRSFQVWLPDR